MTEGTAIVGTRKLTALGENVLIRMFDPELISSGGIILPEKGQDAPNQGTVISIGPAVDPSLGLRVGQDVICCNYIGDRVRIQFAGTEEKILGIQAKEILATVEDDE